jgi:hypothetical protein
MRKLLGAATILGAIACAPISRDREAITAGSRQRPPVLAPADHNVDRHYSTLIGEIVRQVRGDHLRSLISGAMIERRPPTPSGQVIVTVPASETFHGNGTYVSAVERARSTGRYEVFNDRFCTYLHTQSRCRYIFLGASGSYYMVYIDHLNAIIPLIIVPLS